MNSPSACDCNNYETFFNTVDEFLFVLDLEGRILHANATVYQRLGYSPEELHGQHILTVHPAGRREEASAIVAAMIRGEIASCPVPLVTRSGVQIPVETRVTSGIWDGKPALFGVTKDISRVKLSEEKFAALFHLNQSAVGLSDLETLRYIEVNDAFCSFFGYSREEVIGKTAMELGILDEETRAGILRKADATGKIVNVRGNLRDREGNFKYVLLSADNILIQERTYRFTVVHDLTDIVKSEEELRSKQAELQRSNEEKDRFFSIIAHDLRGPFNAFLGLTQLMAEGYSEYTSAEIMKMAESLRHSAVKMHDLLENLLDWARIQQNRIKVRKEKLNLSKIIEDCMSSMEEQATGKEITLELCIPGSLEIIADQNILCTVVRNLVGNAVKFTPRGGKIRVEAILKNSGDTEILVQDNGIGMDHHTLASLFRIDKCTTRKGTEGEPSSGLGLIICHDFIQKLGGKLKVESEKGNGTTFCIILPSGEPLSVPPAAVTDPSYGFAKLVNLNKILIVEDDPASSAYFSLILKRAGIRVFVARNGLEALSVLNSNPDLDLILMDINMPVMDGLEATRRIRQFNTRVPIISQTAYHMNVPREEALAAGCNDHILKPVDLLQLQQAISGLIS